MWRVFMRINGGWRTPTQAARPGLAGRELRQKGWACAPLRARALQGRLREVLSELLGPVRWTPATHAASDGLGWEPSIMGMSKRQVLRCARVRVRARGAWRHVVVGGLHLCAALGVGVPCAGSLHPTHAVHAGVCGGAAASFLGLGLAPCVCVQVCVGVRAWACKCA